MRWTFPVLAFLCILASAQVHCSGVFELRLDSFFNDLGRDADGTCCQGVRPSGSSACSGQCRTRFRICLKHYQATIDPGPPCTYGETLTPVVGNNSVSLGQPETTFANPISFAFDFSWVGTFSLIVEAWHEGEPSTSPGGGGGERRLIARLATQRWLDVGEGWTQELHRTNHTRFAYAVRVRCSPHYYGEGCARLCRPRDDKFGHYVCSSAGEKVCLQGWTGEYCTVAVCLPGCHNEHGYCDQPNECKCRLGWQGTHCDSCIRYPGCLHGTCSQPWQCNCDEGWGGLFCNQDLNYCTNHKPCKHGGTCTNTGQGSYTCTCTEGFSGTNCEEALDHCAAHHCLNGGTCKNGSRNYTCECFPGFSGARCERAAAVNPCSSAPCQNGGTCVEGANGGHLCVCTPAFDGALCETQRNPCEPNPCLNDGSCHNSGRGVSFSCMCPAGFSGPRCERDDDDCAGRNPCANGGTCVDGANTFRCACVPGWVGPTCDTQVDDCLAKPCANGGTCHDLVNDYRCDCAPGFSGKDCSINVDECRSQPCLHGATCEDRVNEFVCHCPEGFAGALCQHRMSNGWPLDAHEEVFLLDDNNLLPADPRPTSVSEIAHQISEEEISPEAVPPSASEQAVVIVCASLAMCLLLLLIPAAWCIRRSRQRKLARQASDAEACRQNEQNSVMNNKCLDRQIVNTLSHKAPKVSNGGAPQEEASLHRTKSNKLLNTDCTCSIRHSKVLDSEHDCAPDRTIEPPSISTKR
ncbi:neurogenic locus protein delta-like [Uloborus diversus]|uniref:neurogenic locus protein delta-like n=1 Tax=Uloborus diversus TaxID=327109 RepID=UPI00240A541F|nr:neurogenic locus protein delta-like [Uloborus diversus]